MIFAQFVLWRQRKNARRDGYTPEALVNNIPSTRSVDAVSAGATAAANHLQPGQQYPPPPRSSVGYDGDSELMDSCHQQQLQEMALLRKPRRDTVLSLGGGSSDEVIQDVGLAADDMLSSACPEHSSFENAADCDHRYAAAAAAAGADENSSAYEEHKAGPNISSLLDASVAELRSKAEL